MLRGIITGLFFGGVLGLMVAGVASLLYPLPATVQHSTSAQPAGTQPDVDGSGGMSNPSTTDAPVLADPSAQAPVPADGAESLPNADMASAPKPSLSDVAGGQSAPSADDQADVALNTDEPVFPSPQARAIEEPGQENELSISVDPAQPLSPTGAEETGFTAPQPTPEGVVVEDDGNLLEDMTLEGGETELAPSEPVVASREPIGDLTEKFDERKSTRLPSIGGAEVETTAEAQTPLVSNAQPAEADEGKPLMSIILLDNPQSPVDLAALADFPLPISFAVDALAVDAQARMAGYRAMGLEVFALVDLPAGAAPSDVEVNLASQLSAVPEAVGVIEGLAGGLQENRPVSEQVIAALLDSGHGLLMQPKGLNTAQKLAAREGVPSLTVFRDFDGAGQSEVVMRRFLDQAAFKARQSDGVVMMGRLQPTTVAALASWALQDRAGTVSVVPASAVLQAQSAQ